MSAVLQAVSPEAASLDASISARPLLGLFREIGHLKRVTSAGRAGSIATRLFGAAWLDLVAGRAPEEVALSITARALAATRLADLDRRAMVDLGVPADEAVEILHAALLEVASSVEPGLRARLESVFARPHPALASAAIRPWGPRPDPRVASPALPPRDDGGGLSGGLPFFVDALAAQPRAGATCPGRARIVLGPPENHAEHCLAVSVYGALLSPLHGADVATVFLAALAHHLHNAAMPDAGFAGEVLLGDHLEPVMARATASALDELSPGLRAKVEAARTILPDAGTPEGRAFHAADVIDRVLEIEQHLAAHRVTMHDVLGDMALVHDGPVKAFHERVLASAGLP